jgi:hypothetical protein
MAANTMTNHEKDLLLDSLMHYLTPDIRRKVMHEVPSAYNAYCGREIVVTIVEPVEQV